MPTHAEDEFHPAFGSPLLLRFDGIEEELRSYFIGMEPGRYVICSPGNAFADGNGLNALRNRTRRVRLFHLSEGVMRGYTVRVLGIKTAPFRHLYLSFPEISRSFNLRHHDRVDCHLPARIADVAASAAGMISNISLGGCRMSLLCAADAHPWLREGECYDLSMQLPTLERPLRCQCLLAQRSADPNAAGLLHLGLGFRSFDPEHAPRIEAFIRHVSKYRI